MPGFTKSNMLGYYKFLFGDGSDGDAVISANTNLASTLNGPIVEKKYLNLQINAGAVLSVSNPCKGLILRVRGVLTLNGTISMSNKGCYVPGGAPDLFVHYDDIKIPSVGADGGAAVGRDSQGNKGANGVNGQCGGGGSGGGANGANHTTGAGAGGYVFSGGTGGSGGAVASAEGYDIKNGNPGLAYGQKGGDGVHAVKSYNPGDDQWITGDGRSGGGAGGVTAGAAGNGGSGGWWATPGGVGSGGILIVIANRIIGSGELYSNGAKGGDAGWQGSLGGWGSAGGGGGSGGGSIVLFYGTTAFTGSMAALGGVGGVGTNSGKNGGAGGTGSVRDWSLVQLASHTRI